MGLTLLFVFIILSVGVSLVVMLVCRAPFERVLRHVASEQTVPSWLFFIKLVILIGGISRGVSFSQRDFIEVPAWIELEGTILRLYAVVLETLRGVLHSLAYVLITLAVAFVVVRAVELIKQRPPGAPGQP